MHGVVQDVPRFDYVEVAPTDLEPPSGSRRGSSSCCPLLGTPRVQMMAFVVAQPITATLWSWALHGVIPSIREAFSSHGYLVNILLFYLVFSFLVVGLFPLGVIDLAAGFLFGVWVGFPVALATKTSGSVLCFILSRCTCSEYLRRTMVEHYDWLAALSLMMKEQQFRARMYAGVTALALSLESFVLVPIGARIDSLENMMSRKHTLQEKAALVLGVVLLLTLVFGIRRTVRLQIEQIQRDTAARSSGGDGCGSLQDTGRGVPPRGRREGGAGHSFSGSRLPPGEGRFAVARDTSLIDEHASL
ncbi:unnamed protein product [Ectocarpus sp. CCAP 1310/34]|nr:unnamed protein product [Ectocarpus sp. CCAP 1310/34]